MDIRVQRTRARFRQAMLDLLLEKEYDSITVKELAERAQAARFTFYRNYDDREDLLVDCIDEIQAELLDQLVPDNLENHMLGYSLVLKFYRWVEDNQKLLQALINSRVASLVIQFAQERLAALIIAHLAPWRDEISTPMEIFAQFHANAVTGMIIWWLKSDQSYSVEYLAHTVHWLTIGGPVFKQLPPQPDV